MSLVDSTVWIELLRQRRGAHVVALQRLPTGRKAALSYLIYQEVLQGAASPGRFERLRDYLSTLPILHVDSPLRLHEGAARLDARCRRAGITPRSGHDCVIAQTADEHGVFLLARDRDFDAMASVEPQLRLLAPEGDAV